MFGLRPAFRQMGGAWPSRVTASVVVNPSYRQKKAPTAPQGGKTPIVDVMPRLHGLTPAMHLTDGNAFVNWLGAQPEVN